MQKKPLVAFAAFLFVLSAFVLYEYMWGFLASRLNPPKPDFELSANPDTVFLYSWEGASNKTVITVKSVDGFSGAVDLRIRYTLIIGEVRITLEYSRVTLQLGGQVDCALNFYSVSILPPGTYYIDVFGKSGDLERSVRVFVSVVAIEPL